MGSSGKRYTPEFKQKAVELYRSSESTYVDVAKDLGIDKSTLRTWVRLANATADGNHPATKKSNPFEMEAELKRLKRENAQLKRDNEILLKASAFFASKNL